MILTGDQLLGSYYDKGSPLDKNVSVEGLKEVAKDQEEETLKAVGEWLEKQWLTSTLITGDDIDTLKQGKFPS